MNSPIISQDTPDATPQSLLRHFAAPEGKRTVILSTVHISDFDIAFSIYSDIVPLLPCSSVLRPVFIGDRVLFFMDYSAFDGDSVFYAPEILSMVSDRIFKDYLSVKRNTF